MTSLYSIPSPYGITSDIRLHFMVFLKNSLSLFETISTFQLSQPIQSACLTSHVLLSLFYFQLVALLIYLCKLATSRSSHSMVFYKGVRRNFAKFTGKHLCLSLKLYLKRDSGTGVFLLILRNFLEHLFCRTSANGCFCINDLRSKFVFMVLSSSPKMSP